MTLLRKWEKYRENYPAVKGLGNIFAKFSPSENNHIYSTHLQQNESLISSGLKVIAKVKFFSTQPMPTLVPAH